MTGGKQMKRTYFYELASAVSFNTKKAGRRRLAVSVNMKSVIEENLTKKQKSYIMLYYVQNKSVTQIARMCGVNKSTVSRTLSRARSNIEKAVGYAYKEGA